MSNKRYDNVQLTVTFGDTLKVRNQNISSGENIAQSLGKISTWYDSLVPTGGSSGKILVWNSSGTAKWNDPLHPTITQSADTTSTEQLSHGGPFTAITSVTRDGNGHVTKINTATYTLPAQYTHPTYTTYNSGLYKITVDGTGHVSAATAATASDLPSHTHDDRYLKLAGGTLTGDVVDYTTNKNTKITVNASSILQSPIPKYLWHDLFAFCRIATPTYYTTTDNTTWTAGTLNKDHFIQKDSLSINVISATGKTGSRWLWNSSSFSYSSGLWLVIGVAYQEKQANATIVFETSTDGTTWTVRHQSTHTGTSSPIWCKIDAYSNASYFRLTITKDTSDTTKSMRIGAIKLLTSRWGDQGQGSELEKPYNWDYSGTITPLSSTSDLGTNANKWRNIYATTFYGELSGNASTADKWKTARTLTIGNTGKSVDGSDNVSWSLSEIGAAPAVTGGYLPLSGGTMTGQIKTSFRDSIATGSMQASSTTIPNLCEELRYSSGVMGSVSINTAYTKDGITVAATWYNFIWIPHRSGGVNGNASGDNCSYGSLILSGMTSSGAYIVRYSGSAISELRNLYKDTTYSANNGVGLSGTTFYNTGVRSTTINGNYLRVNTNGTDDDLTIPYATSSTTATKATQDGDGNTISSTYLKLSGGTMTGDISFTAVTSTSYPASSKKLYWSGSTDWAKIYYRVDASDAGRLVFDIGDDTNTRIDFAYNGTTKSYIDTSGNFSGTAAAWTTARTLTLSGAVTGSASIKGDGDISLVTTVNHTHNYAGSSSAGGGATKISTSTTNGPDESTNYGIIFVKNPDSSQDDASYKTNDFRVKILKGASSTTGFVELVLGNNIDSASNNNKQGILSLFSSGTGWARITYDDTTEQNIFKLPAKTSGTYTIATTADIPAYSDTKVKVTSNATAKAYLIGTTTTPNGTAVEGIADTGVFLGTTAGSLYAGDFKTTSANHGVVLNDGIAYGGIFDNGSNLWIGAVGSTQYHHRGLTLISTGWSGTLPTSAGSLTGNPSIEISIPTYTVAAGATTGTWNHVRYSAIHSGNFTTTGSGNAITSVSFTDNKLTFTKGSTFLTSHQSVTDGNPTLSWGTQSTVATIGSTNIHVTMPANPNTDEAVAQTADNSSNSDNYELLISNSANNTTETAGVRKSSRLRFNPSNGRVIMQGPLIVRATDGVGSYDEGIRINAGKAGFSTLAFGGGQDTMSGAADGLFWIGTNSTNDSYKRKLYIGHNVAINSKTYFYAESSSQHSTSLRVGGDVYITTPSTDSGCKMRYNPTTQSLDFVFV